MDSEQLDQPTEKREEGLPKPAPKNAKGEKDWKDRFLELDLLSPIYLFVFILLFKDGKDGLDLHDAIIKFISTYNGQ